MSTDPDQKEMQDLIKLEEEISNFFEDLMYDWGGSPLLGRIYSQCALSIPNDLLLQSDFANKFKVNPSTISRNLKELENLNLITKRRDPGSREWKYLVDGTSFLELLVNKFDTNATNLHDRLDDLVRIRNHWGETLSEESRNSKKGKHAQKVLDRLIEWMTIVETELEGFLKNLHNRYLELEKKFEQI
ncbi:MAG: MarR family transcriptional regulator [Candidatus Hodarchaeales archaeon]|jgi:DNA-binding transcriptional regulator GbsR (MarR family)